MPIADPVRCRMLRLLHRRADVLDAGKYRRQRDELTIKRLGRQTRQRGLAHPRWAPQDHRVWLARLKGQLQRLALAQQMGLPDDIGQLVRA